MLIQLTTGLGQVTSVPRTAGWSESWYTNNTNIDAAKTAFLTLCQRRAALLPTRAAVVGQRYQIVDPAGSSSTGTNRFPGSAGEVNDVPQMALFYRLPGVGVRNFRPVYIRGIPDDLVKEGEYVPNASYRQRLTNFFGTLASWQFKGRQLTANKWPIVSISNTGAYRTSESNTLAANQMVEVMRTRDDQGVTLSGTFPVLSVTDAFTGQLGQWPGGAWTSGSMRVPTNLYPFCNGPAVVVDDGRAVVKKVGRPFLQYRGRATTRN